MLGVRSLSRTFGETVALDEVSFEVRPGRMTGFVGANGAGKTTAMRIIVGVLAATGGEVLWQGEPITAATRRAFGYMPEERGLYPKMRVIDQLVYFARLHGHEPGRARQRAGHLLDRLGLAERAEDPLEKLSLGNQQRAQIAAALVHDPVALVLDEPFSGLDPLAVDAMTALLREELAADLPVLFSSHQLELVEALCDDLIILNHGRLVAAGAVPDLLAGSAVRYRVRWADGCDAEALRGHAALTLIEARGPEAIVEPGDTPPGRALELAQDLGPVVEFARMVRPLSQVYRESIR